LDIIAIGFDPDRTFVFQDTEYIRNIYPLALRIAKKVNFSTVKAVFGFENATNIGMLFYPSIQIVPTMFEKKRCLIPAAIDQDPYWRIQRDIAESLGYLRAAEIHSKFIPPLTGMEGKMSSSQPETAVYLSDDPRTVRNKIMKYAFSGGQDTVEKHRKLGGDPDVDVSFQWLNLLFEPNEEKIKSIEQDYRSGKMLTGELKEILVQKLNGFLEKHGDGVERAKETVTAFKHSGKLATQMWETTFE
jgi:tryptophanyl-tRNA synthetase